MEEATPKRASIRDDAINLPNLLTMLRIALIPVFVVIFYLPVPWARPACALVFTVAALTDWLDGWLARRWRSQSVPV